MSGDDRAQATSALPERANTTLRVHALALAITDGPDKGRTMRIDRPMTFIVGTGPSADLQLTDDTVSREHLRLTLRHDGVFLRDEGSTNGTWLGALRVHEVTM